jgi:hypothetical protein
MFPPPYHFTTPPLTVLKCKLCGRTHTKSEGVRAQCLICLYEGPKDTFRTAENPLLRRYADTQIDKKLYRTITITP